jgi:hypothetical protein
MTNRAKPNRGHLTALPETPVLVVRRETASETKAEMLISGSRRLERADKPTEGRRADKRRPLGRSVLTSLSVL